MKKTPASSNWFEANVRRKSEPSSMKTTTTRSNWFEDFFHGVVNDLWRKCMSPEQTRAEADFLEQTFGSRSRLLDVPCGNGRHSLELARRGCRMTGLDISTDFIAEAKARDARYGQVLSFTPRTNQVSAQPSAQGLSNLKVTFDITRSKLKYAVTLTVEKVGNQYKIVDYQQI